MILEAKRNTHEKKPKPEPIKEKTKRKKSPFELHEKFINKFKNNEKTINEQMFKQYFFIIFDYFHQKNYIIAIKM